MSESAVVGVTSIEETIASFVAELSGIEVASIDVEGDLLSSGWVDSVGMMRLIAHMEECLDLQVPAAELVPENFRTLRVMARFLDGLRSG